MNECMDKYAISTAHRQRKKTNNVYRNNHSIITDRIVTDTSHCKTVRTTVDSALTR